MINRKIKVEYEKNKETHEILSEAEWDKMIIGSYLPMVYIDKWIKHSETFTKFTNKGRVSKTEESEYDRVNRLAEKLLQKQLAIEADTDKDMARAKELVKIINAADFNSRMTVIKIKTSHSKWYQHNGDLYTPSEYLTLVPSSVAKEAKELQGIRRKHQNNPNFDFYASDYRKEEIRVADHDNDYSLGYIDSTTITDEDLHKEFDWMI